MLTARQPSSDGIRPDMRAGGASGGLVPVLRAVMN
jgi:hypothetical protein